MRKQQPASLNKSNSTATWLPQPFMYQPWLAPKMHSSCEPGGKLPTLQVHNFTSLNTE
jgi:hypothetical protein